MSVWAIKTVRIEGTTFILLMRSLYTSDIEGTTSRPTIFDKGYYRHQHDQQARIAQQTKQNQHEWYVPVPRPTPPAYTHEPARNTIKLISEHTGLSRSMHYESLKKRNDNDEAQRRSALDYSTSHVGSQSLLSQSGSASLSRSKAVVGDGGNPYFPHRIRDSNDRSSSTRFTGNRNWNYTPNAEICLPDPGSEYVSKWIKL